IREAVPGIDEQVAAAIMKGLALDPKDRWQTIDPMIYQFREAQERLFPKPARPRRPAGVSVLDQPAPVNKKMASQPRPKAVGPTPGITLADDDPPAQVKLGTDNAEPASPPKKK